MLCYVMKPKIVIVKWKTRAKLHMLIFSYQLLLITAKTFFKVTRKISEFYMRIFIEGTDQSII